MRILVDAMGGDNAPRSAVEGAILAAADYKSEVILVGRGVEILECLKSMGIGDLPDGIEIANASEVVYMDDDPSRVVRQKKDSSMMLALNMLRDGDAHALVSAGSTGALLAGSTLIVKRISEIRRAALAPILPKMLGNKVIIDSGANLDCTPEYLLQFGIMGSSLSKHVLGKENPKVGLLNIGVEVTKGTQLHRDAYAMLNSSDSVNFIGNIEARDALTGDVDVLVCDGFSGNVFLKTVEGMGLTFLTTLKGMLTANAGTKLAALLLKPQLKSFKSNMDYSEVGGSLLLGISKPVIKAHGSSDSWAIRNAIGLACRCAESKFINEIEQEYSR